MNPYIQTILTEMCSRVGADYESIDFSSPDWYLQYTWTTAEEKEFSAWLFNYLMDNKEARANLYGGRVFNKWTVSGAVQSFIFSYGWKVDNGKTETR